MINEIEDKNNRRNLYEALKGDFDLGTAEQFEKSMQSAEARKNLWNAIHEDYDVGTFEQFEKDMMGDKVKPEQVQPSQPTNAQPNQPQPQQPQQAQFQQSLPITSKVGQTEQGNKQIAQVHNQQSSSQAMPPQATMNAPQPRQQVMSLNDRQKLWTWRNIKPTLSTGQTEQQYNARWNNEVENVKRRNDPDEIAAFNAFQKELAQQQAKVQQQGYAIVETGNQPFQSESGTEVWPISFSRKTIPHNQDYVFTLRAMQQAKGTYDLQYNIKDPEIRRDYEALTAPTDDTYRPTDAILDASPREKNKYYQWYAAYLYSNGGEMPEWLDYTAQLKLRSLNKSELESEAKQWTNLVERTRNARKFRGSNSVSDWLNEQYNFKSGDPRIINGASYPYLVTRAGLIQTPLVQTTGRATVADNRRSYNESLQSNEQSKANPAQGDVYSTSSIINPERFWANTTKWQDLSESQKAAYKDEADYYNQMLKGQANVSYYSVGNGQNEEVEFLKHNRKQMNEQYNMLTDKERTQAVMKQAERTLNVLNGISHNLNTKLRFSIMGKGVEEDNGIRSVIRRYEKFLEVAPRYLEKRNYSAALQFWNGLTDLNGLTFGLLGVADAVSLNKIANNPPKDLIEKFGGEANAKKVIATAIQLDNMAEEYRQKLDYYGTGYSLGGLTQFGIQAGLPLFKGTEAVGKILTGGMRGLVKKATLRYMPNTAKRLGAKELVQATIAEGTRQAMREGGIGGAAGYVAGRLGVANGVSTIVGKAAQGSVEGVVLSVPHAIANVTNNRTGQANVVEINREGIKVNDQPFTHMNQAPDGKVEADTMLREWSQWVGMRVGEVFMPFSKYVDGKVANVAKGAWNKSVGRFIDGSSFARITETFSKAANVGKAATEVGKYVSGNLKRAGMGGTLTFYAQTNLSEMLNAMTVGDVSWDDIKSDQLDKLWGAFVSNAYLVAQNNLVGTVGYYNQKSNLNKSLAQYDAQGSAAWGETDWNGIKADVDRLIDNDKNLQAYQNGVLANENLSKPQRETISQYIATRKTLQAFDLFAKVGNEKSKPNEFDIRYNDAYIAGTQVKSPDQMAQMRESLDASRNTLANLLGIKPEQVDALFADTNKSLGQIYEELTQQFVDNGKANLPNGQSVNATNIEPIKRAIDHYCTALSMQRGVSESLITSQLEAVQKLDAKVDAATNKDSGMIERATDDMGRECYVISGNADSSNNTDMVVVRYTEDGRVASLSPKQVTIIQQTDAHELKQTNADLVDLNYEGILNSIVNGKTLPEPNDQVVLYDGKSRGVATIEGIKYEESTKDGTRGVAAQPKSVVIKTEDGRIIELPIDTYRQWVRDGFKHDTEVYVHGTESDNSENTNEPTEGTENATEAPTLAEGLRVSINGNEYTIGKVDDSCVELIDENGKDFHWTRSALDKKLKSGDAEILASNEENTQQKPELHYGDEVELNDPDNGENIRGKVNSRDASDEVEIVTDDGRVLRYSKRELDNVIQNVYNNGEHIWSKDENKTEEASNETDTEQEPQPIGKGVFGNIYDQFKGKVKAAFDFLMKHKSGDLLGVFHRDEVGDIDLVWGNENGGLSHIITKHVGEGKDFETPEKAIEKIEEVLKDGEVIQNGQMRYVVSKDGYRVAIRKDFDGEKKNWVVTAIDYNRTKEEKGIATNPTSASHGVNGSELAAPNNSFADKVTEQSATAQAEATQNEPMPMHTVGKGKNAVLTEDWLTTTPKRGFDYIFSESGLDAEEGREFVNNKLAEAQKNLDKVKNGKPKMGTSIAAYKEAKEAYTTHVEDAQKAVDYWQSVKAEHDKVLLAERHARDEKDKALHEQAVAEEQQRMQDDARKATEQAELGSNAVAPTIRDKWNAAKKENGDADEITLPNGEVVKGHYVLTESGAASASHQATNGFAETEGFPIDENGQSVNDRDYKRDQEAQQVTRSMATDYDQRALQSPVVVSQEGVVLSGNGRTMAGELAAQDGTDTKYVDYLHSHANKFGFTPEQVNGFKHPRVVFVPNEAMPYNADTFAKFNQREQKSQNNTEMAVKMGKVVNDALFGRIMDMVSKYDTLGEFYADDNATYAVVKQLAEADIIPQTEMAHLFDGGKLSEAGQSMIEGVMIGKVFQANPDAVRQITEVKSMRQAVMTALQDIVQNNRLGGGYNLSNELAEAVNLVYRARKAGYKLGQHVSDFAHQGNLFEYDEGATVADFNNMAVMMLADVLNDGRSTQLKKVIAFYNEQATDAAQGIGDMFVGGVKSKTEIINEVNKALNNGREYNTTATSLADGQGQRNQSSKQSNDVGTSGTDGKPTNYTSAVTAETDVESGATEGEKSSAKGDVVPSGNGDTPLSEKIATASAEVNTEPTEAQKEAGNYKKGHVQVGTFDITIEQPQGSVRKGTDADGKQWESKMNNTYGYIRGAVGVDGDHIDVFLSNDIDGWNGRKVFVVDQYNPDGSFDEHKVMLGFNDADEAKSDYLANYEKGWEDGRRIDVTAVNLEDFEKWIESSKRKTKPFGEYSSVKKDVVERNEVLEYEKALDHLEDVEQKWKEKIQDYVYEHYPTQATISAESTSEKGLQERKAMKVDPVLKQIYAEAKKEIDAAEEMVTQKYSALPEDLRQQKADGKPAQLPTREETILRDVVIDHMKESGLDVLGTEEGQRVLDMVNGRDVRLSAKQKRALETASLGNNPRSLTVVSSADGAKGTATIADDSTNKATGIPNAYAKVQTNLENLARVYAEKATNKTRGFITDLSRALNLTQHEASNYGTFALPNGKTLAIRISNHNALVSNFDKNNENNGISIVISSHRNKRLNNDGKAHIVEYFYHRRAIENATGKPLAEILESIKDAINSGEFKDTTGLAEREEVNEDMIREHRVYHGSGADFDAFDHSHMGEGEGAQAYGWGTYVTEVEGIGRTYAVQNAKVYGAYIDAEHEYEKAKIIYNSIVRNIAGLKSNLSVYERSLGKTKKLIAEHGDDQQFVDKQTDRIKRTEASIAATKAEIKAAMGRLPESEKRMKSAKERLDALPAPERHLYTIEIPDDNGRNYLDWNGHPTESLLKDVGSFLESNGFERVQDSPARYEKGESTVVLNPNATGADLYAELQEALGSDKKASQTLAELGYIGIKYPANNMRGGREDGAKNYVIFNENDAKITDHVRFFKTKNGEAYGFTIGGKIYIDPKVATSETPVHEYAHLWATALKANNAKEWQNVVGLMKGTSVWEEVKKLYPELKSDDEIADEVLATYSGRRGAERLRKEMDDIAKSNGNVFDKATAMNAMHRVKQAIEKFWKAVADFLHIHYTSAEQVADQVMKDLLDGVDPRSMMDGGKSLRPETRINIVAAKTEHGFKNYAEAKTWAKEHIARTYSGEETGGKGDIRISNAAVDKYLSQSAVDKSDSKDVHLSVLKVLPDVIRESVDAEQHADYKKGEDGVRSAKNGINPNVTIHRLYGAVRMDGKVYRVKVTLKDDKTSKEPKVPHSYEATKIELFAGTLGNSDNSLSPNTNNSITAANLLKGVEKSYDGGKFFEDYNKIREQFIGEQGAERADHAEEVSTRLDNLSVAREMENDKKDAKAIKMATGWERGSDGKWRYEIPDLKYFSKGDAGYKKAREKQPWSKELDGLSDKIFDGEELSDSENQRFDELAQKEEKFKTDYLNREKPHLADWVENDELFKAYPDLKRVELMFTDQLPANMGGSYNERDHTIVVNTNYVGDIASVLAHEVQHAIQKIEGFASGGNPESMQERFEAAKEEWRARAWADALRDKADEMGEHYNQAAVEKALIDEYKEMGMDNDEWMPNKETRMKGFNYFARGYADRSMDADIKNFRLAESTRADFSPYVEYTKLGGEVESRNVEHRMNMTPEERRAILAAETEDVSREDQIFLMSGDGGNANSEIPQEMGTGDDYSEFAKEHGVDADMVKDYASGMKTGNLQKADIALAEIRRTMRVANRGMKLSEFGKLFRPVQKELAERYGDIEKLRQEHIDAAMRERGVMEAARKRAEEEEAKRKARADELSLLSTEELDKRYFDAIESGDDAAAREMLDEAARRKGYDDTESNYQGVGAWIAPSNPGYESDAERRADVEDNAPDVNIEDIALGYSLVDEKYWQEPRKYMQTDATAIESVNAIREAIAAVRRGEKNVKVKVYRAVPTSVKEGKLRNGDWVTPSKDYAKMHGEHRLEGKYRIIEDEVSVNELWWDGNDSREWGFDDGRGYKYKNVENNRKLNDLVTRDDNGEIIPPSKRFDENVEDVRYRETEPKTLKGEVALTALENIFSEPTSESLPKSISTLESFKEVFKHPIRTFLGELVKVKDEVFNKIIREKRSNISGAVLSTIENADFAIRDKDGSTLYIKRFKSDNSGNTYNIVAVNKHGEVEDYVSSVHIKRDGNLRNKIKNGAELLLPQERNTDGTLSRNNSTPTAKVENNPDTSQLSLQEKSMHQAAKAVANEMHLGGNVDVLTSTDGLTGRKKNAKGWYDPQTGRITIVLPNHNGRADVVNTMLHEAVGHYGLRELVGKEKMNEFLDFVFKNADKATRSQIAHNSAKYGWDMRKATEEYMASMAEDGTFKNVNKRWWHQLKLAFLKMLHKLGFAGFSGTTLSDNDLRYLLWRSWKNLAEGPARNIYQVAEDTWRQQHLKVGDFAEPKAVDAKTREQNLYYREERERKSARDEYERSVNTAKHKMNLAWVDSMSGLKLLQDAIVPNEKDLKDWENAYMAENRMSSTNLAEMETYKKSFYKDLLDAEQELLDKGTIHEQVTNYMMAKHGLERNEVLAFRDALKHDFANDKQKMSAAWKAYKNDATAQQNKTDFESGKISWDDYKANDTAIREKYAPSYKKYRSKDYSGLTELTTDDPSIKSYQDQIATLKEQLNNERDDATKKSIRIKIAKLNKEMVNEAERIAENSSSNFEKKYDTSELWNRTNAATKASLTKQYESGLLTDEVYHHTLDMFKNYIPLRGFDDVTSDEVYNYFGNAKGQFGGGIRSAKGRKSKADDPIATIGNMAESAIMQGNRNQMKQHFLKMVLNHPSDAVSVDQLYLHYDAATQEWKPVFAEFDEHDDANAVAQKVEAFNQRMETLCQQNPDEYKKASEAHDIQYKVVGKNINEHQVHVKMQGKDYVLTINGNPEAAQALNGQTNPDSTDNPFIKFFQSTNHFMAAMFTQKNPAFILSNLSRDSFYANSMVWAKESPAYAWKFNKNWGKSLYTLFGLITRQRKGTLNMNDKVDRMYQEFIENGGETGYTFLHSVDDYKNMIAKALKESRRSGWNPKSWLKFLDNLINYLGTWAENTSRFAAYRTSREMGRSIEKSIWDAKEISVNFNKKGAGAKAAGKWEDGNRLNVMQAYMSQSAKELYVFWNAGVQGLSNVSRTFGKSKGKTLAVAGLYFAIGTALPMLMAALSQGSGDDDTNYYDLPDWVRRNNLCFYTGKGWVTIPLPIELRAFYGLGELAQSVLSGNEEYTATDIATKMLEQVSQLFPVDFMEGGGSLTSFVPSYAKPIVEAYVTNKDYTGTPIYKDAEYNKNRPEWTKAYKGTNQALVWASRLLNELGGGDDVKKANVGVMDVNPAKIQHLFEGYFGGLGKFVFQTMKVASMPFNEDNRELKNVPIINSFYKTSDERTKDRAITSKFYKYNDEYQKTKELLSLYKKELQAPEYKSKFYDLMYSPEGFSATMMDSYNKQLSAVRKAMSVTDPNSDKYKELQQQQVDIQKQAVKVIEATKGVVNSEDKEMKELYNLWMQDYSNDPKKAEERSNKTIEMRKDIVKRIMDIAKQNKPQKK
jgi:hypothetical protein